MKKILSEPTKEKRIDKIFTDGNLPPLFGENFSRGNLSWKRLSNIAFEDIGRILICHLLIETQINKLIEVHLSEGFDIDSANLNFIQKLKLIRTHHVFRNVNFYPSITVINVIRNRYSHNIEAKIDDSEIGIIAAFLRDYSRKDGNKHYLDVTVDKYSELAIIELFTSLFCAYNSGYCSSKVERW